ncbi:hypothetical protein SMX40_004196 [Cronobacter turicensis]|nr:hypothetical protein [Cronobacter turicensis]ELY3628949.1 hypothetical protein [Cronobacter turicensis]
MDDSGKNRKVSDMLYAILVKYGGNFYFNKEDKGWKREMKEFAFPMK